MCICEYHLSVAIGSWAEAKETDQRTNGKSRGLTPPETNSSPLKIGRNPKRKDRLPTIHFQVLLLLVSGRVAEISWNPSYNKWWHQLTISWYRIAVHEHIVPIHSTLILWGDDTEEHRSWNVFKALFCCTSTQYACSMCPTQCWQNCQNEL